MVLTRRAGISLEYKGKNITEQLDPFVSSVSVTENLKGGADSLSLSLNNKENKLLKPEWLFDKGEKIDFYIKTTNWENATEGTVLKNVGTFFIDTRNFNRNKVSVKAISMPISGGYDQENSKVWDEITLEALGKELAKKYKIGFKYLCDETVKYKSLKQDKKTDFSFLDSLVREEGLCLKIAFDKLVLFDISKYENQATERIIDLLGGEISDWGINEKTKGIYDAIEIKYLDTVSMKEEKATYTRNQLESGSLEGNITDDMKVLKLNKRSNAGDLQKLARKLLKQKNDTEIIFDFTLQGDRSLIVGKTFYLKNAYSFNGKYMITNISTSLPGYKNKVTAYKIKGVNNV